GEAVSQMKEAHAVAAGERPPEMKRDGVFSAPPIAPHTEPSVSLPVAAHVPADYIEDEPTRLNFYQRFATISSGGDLGALVDELRDRFGPLPEPVQNLVYIVGLRLAARRAGVQQVQSVDGEVVVKFERLPRVDVPSLSRAVGVPLRAGSNQLRLARGRGQDWMTQLLTLVE